MLIAGGSFRPINLPLKLPDPDELAKLPEGAVVMLHGGVTARNIDTSYLQQESKDLRWKGDVPPAYPTGMLSGVRISASMTIIFYIYIFYTLIPSLLYDKLT